MALAAVRSLRTLHADGASPQGDLPEELAVKGISGDDARDQRVSGLYSPDGTHSGKPVYKKVSRSGRPRPLIYFHADEGKWTLGDRLGEVEYRHDDSSLGPPLGQWNRSSGERGLTVSVIPQMLQVEGADEDLNGFYVRCENFNDRPLFRCVGRQAPVLKFECEKWYIQKFECYAPESCRTSEYGPPICTWRHGSRVSVVQLPFPEAPRFLWVQGAGKRDRNGIYACTHSHQEKPRYVKVGDWGSIFFDDGCWKLGVESFGWRWVYICWGRSTSVPPATGWTNEECPGRDPPPQLILQESYSASAPFIEALSQPGESSSQPPFLVVAGAGLAAVNGRYACVGSFGGEPKYKQLGGSSIIHYNCGRWQLNQQDSTSERYYDGPENRSPLPTSGWENLRSQDHPAPQVSLGTQHDLQTGDRVLMVKDDFDGFDFPPGSQKLFIGSSPVRCSIGRLQGDFFSTEIHPTKLVPLGALGSIEFNRCWHCISDAQRTLSSSASAPARAFGASTAASSNQAARQEEEQAAEPEGGFDEEWCPDQDLERFRCCICMLVARDAMVHECGAVLFCEMCWVKCQADSSNCPVCRKDGSEIAKAHSDRRLIRNLMIMCPNKCGEKFPLCEKDKHIKDSCQKRQVTCTECDRSYDADAAEEHQKECPARIVPCRLCGEEVKKCDMDDHFRNHPGCRVATAHMVIGLMDKVASLEAELKKLKGEA